MKLLEHHAKTLLASFDIPTPEGALAASPAEASTIADGIGRSVVKAQIAAGGRGKAGGITIVENSSEARSEAARLIGSTLNDHRVDSVLVEQAIDIDTELYLAILIDSSAGCPAFMASRNGGIDIEDNTESIVTIALDPSGPLTPDQTGAVMSALDLDSPELRDVVHHMHAAFNDLQALLIEINPLVVTKSGAVVAVDAKVETDDAAPPPPGLNSILDGSESRTELEERAADHGLRMIELGGNVAILANGAGLTMTTMDAVVHHGGKPANFLEIGGDAYTLAEPALALTLEQAGVRSLLVNFCGAFARCDVMTEGVVNALETLRPNIPVFFSIHGTGQDEAREMVRNRLGIEPYEAMDDAVAAAVMAADKGAES